MRALHLSPPKARAWLLAYNSGGLDLYEIEGGSPVPLSLPTLWLPEAYLGEVSGSAAADVLAVRTTSDELVPKDLALGLFHLLDGRLIRHIPLFSRSLSARMLAPNEEVEPRWKWDDPYLALLDRWFVSRWSPDGQSLTFADRLISSTSS